MQPTSLSEAQKIPNGDVPPAVPAPPRIRDNPQNSPVFLDRGTLSITVMNRIT